MPGGVRRQRRCRHFPGHRARTGRIGQTRTPERTYVVAQAGFPVTEDQRACLHICVTCGSDDAAGQADSTPGRRLHDSVAALLAEPANAALSLQPVVCLANCERGCSAIVSAPRKWAYMVGGLGPEHAADLVAYARAYAASERGVVLRAGRPESMRDVILGRFPADVSGLAWTPAARKEAAE